MKIGLGRIYADHAPKPYATFCNPQHFTVPDIVAPSGRWNRSLTKTVLRIQTARWVLTRIAFLMRLTFGALSLGSHCPQAFELFVHVQLLHQPIRSGDNQNGF
jgi:hypothetical protein